MDGDESTALASPEPNTGVQQDEPRAAPDPRLPDHGFQWGLKLGMELPLGHADGGLRVLGQELRSGELDGYGAIRVPIALDLGYRLDSKWWLGLEAGTGLGPVGHDCPESANCEWSSMRLGAQAIVHLDAGGDLDPWVGAIVGYEWLRSSVGLGLSVDDDMGNRQTAVAKAKELLGGPQLALQAGLDFSLEEHVTLGPFASAAVGMYLQNSYDCPGQLGCPDGGRVEDARVHAWLGLGVRGTHGP